MISQTEFPEEVFKPLLEAYKKYTIPVYGERPNSGKGQTQSMGILNRRNYGVGYSRNNDSFPDILREARALAKIICPHINYTTIAVNVNYEATDHRDRNNIGASCVVAFGDFEGGKLKIGDTEYNVRHAPLTFEAAKNIHSVSAISSGRRFSCVWFRQRFPKKFYEKYGHDIDYDGIAALIPPREADQRASAVRVPL
jgi:hypothetical protein